MCQLDYMLPAQASLQLGVVLAFLHKTVLCRAGQRLAIAANRRLACVILALFDECRLGRACERLVVLPTACVSHAVSASARLLKKVETSTSIKIRIMRNSFDRFV